MTSVQTSRRHGVNGSLAIKAPVKSATTANITLSGEQTIDSVAIVSGDRVLVKNQTDGIENGIYAANTSTWQREPDWDGARDVAKGTSVYCTDGSTTSSSWRVTTADPIIPGTTSISFQVVTAQDLDFAGDSGGNLAIDLDTEVLTIAGGTGIDTSGAVNTLTIDIDSTVTTLTGTQTLTNKTLTSPTIDLSTVTSSGDLPVANGGTGSSTASGARTNLGLAIGSNVQAHDVDLDALAALSKTDSNFIVGNGSTWVAETGATARTSLGVDVAGTDNSTDVTLGGTPNYITISGQVITRGSIDLTTDVTGDLPIAEGGTGASTASAAFTALKQAATESATGVMEIATDAETSTGTDDTRAITPLKLATELSGIGSVTNGDAHDHDGGDGAAIPAGGIAADAIIRAKIKTATVSMAGALGEGTTTDIILANGYAFFPMIHGIENDGTRAAMFADNTDGADPDSPRFALQENGGSTGDGSYDVDYRYISAA